MSRRQESRSRSRSASRSRSPSPDRGMSYKEMLRESGLRRFTLSKAAAAGQAEKNTASNKKTVVDRLKDNLRALHERKPLDKVNFRSYSTGNNKTGIVNTATAFRKNLDKGLTFNLLLGYFGTEEQLNSMTIKFARKSGQSNEDYMIDVLDQAQVAEDDIPYLVVDLKAINNDSNLLARYESIFPVGSSTRLTDEAVDQHIKIIMNTLMFNTLPGNGTTIPASELESKADRDLHKAIAAGGRVFKTLGQKIDDIIAQAETDTKVGDRIIHIRQDSRGEVKVNYTIGTAVEGRSSIKRTNAKTGTKGELVFLTVYLGDDEYRNNLFIRLPWIMATDNETLNDLMSSTRLRNIEARTSILSEYSRAESKRNKESKRESESIDQIPDELEEDNEYDRVNIDRESRPQEEEESEFEEEEEEEEEPAPEEESEFEEDEFENTSTQ